MSNGTILRPANRCRMASWRASTADCVTSASTSTCSPTSRRHARSSKNGGSTTTPTDRTRASTGSHRRSSQHAQRKGITGTDSPYKRGHIGEQVMGHGQAVMFCIVGGRASRLYRGACERLKAASKQLSGQRPGLIWMHFLGLDEEEFVSLRAEATEGKRSIFRALATYIFDSEQ